MSLQEMPVGPPPRAAPRKKKKGPGRPPVEARVRKGDHAVVGFKFLPAMKDLLRDFAAEDKLTMTGWIERKIIDTARARGLARYDRTRGYWIEIETDRPITQGRRGG